jgi:tetratricopeptide (TPR) repeat protein
MKKFYVILFTVWLAAACGTEAAKNENAAVNQAVNTNQNVNTGTNQNTEKTLADEPVPKFTDAAEALKKGEEYLDKNETEKAIDALKQAVELEPDLADAHFRLGIAYALEETEEEAEIDPTEEAEPTPAKKSKKTEKEKKKNSEIAFDNAVKSYKKYIAKNPKDAQAHYNLGRAYNKLGSDYDDDARKALEKSVKLDEENSLYRTELGSILIELAQYPEAIKQLKKAIELDEDNLQAEDLLEIAEAGKKRTEHKDKK